jgi:hypothetical protein
MAGDFLFSTLSTQDIGLIVRQKVADTDTANTVLVASKGSEGDAVQGFIRADDNNEYNFTPERLALAHSAYQAFYDGEAKIAEYFYDKKAKAFVLNVLTTKQFNLFADIACDELTIKAVGPLCIDAKITVKKNLTIEAKCFSVSDAVFCEGDAVLNAEQGMVVFAEVHAKTLDIHAAYFCQEAPITVEGQYDISAQAYQQKASAKTVSNNLRLVADQCDISGDLDVKENVFLTANNLFVAADIEFLGQHHVHVGNCVVKAGSNFSVMPTQKKTAEKLSNNFTVDNCLFVAENSWLKLKNTKLHADAVENSGSVSTEGCHVFVNRMEQNNQLEMQGSTMTVSDCFVQYGVAQSKFSQVEFNNKAVIIKGGLFLLSDSEWTGRQAYVYAGGRLGINDSSDVFLGELISFDPEASLSIGASTVAVENNMRLYGNAVVDAARIVCDSFRSDKKLTLSNSAVINASNNVNLAGDFDSDNSTIHANRFRLEAKSKTRELAVYAAEIECISPSLNMDRALFSAKRISVIGVIGANEADKVFFKESHLATERFSFKENVQFESSTLVGIEDANRCHSIQGNLTLVRSRFLTESQLHAVREHLHLDSFSTVRSGLVYSKSTLSVTEHSRIHCDAFLGQGGALHAEKGLVNVRGEVIATGVDVRLNSGSVLASSNTVLAKGSSLRLKGKSVLVAREKLRVDSGAKATSHSSTIATKRFVVLGRAELHESMLSAQELLIFEQFSASKKTVVNVEEQITLAKTARAKLEGSMMISRELRSFGDLVVDDSAVQVKEAVSLWSTSTTEMRGNSQLAADKLLLRGEVKTKTKTNSEAAAKKEKIIMEVKKKVDVLRGGSIAGDANLMLLADEINQTGTVDLSADFSAKGRQFNNTGATTARSIYLGFDDSVVNHGMLSSKNMTIHSSFMNVLGSVYASQSFNCSGIASINLGFIAANNYNNDSIFSLSMGLTTPNLCADASDIFTVSNLGSAAKTAAIGLMPGYSNGIHLAAMIPGLLSTGMSLFDLVRNNGLEKISTMRRHEYIPIFCQLKSAVMFGSGFLSSYNGLESEYSNWSEAVSGFMRDPSSWQEKSWSAMQAANWNEIGMRSAGSLAGSYYDTSLVHINLGASLAGNTSKTNCLHMNFGVEHSLFSHNINTQVLHNSGVSSGRDASFTAVNTYNSGRLEGTHCFSFKGQKVKNTVTGEMLGRTGVNVNIGTLEQEGRLEFAKGQVNIDRFRATGNSTSGLTDVALSGSAVDIQDNSRFAVKNCAVKEKEHVVFEKNTHVETDNTSVNTKEVVVKGQLNHQNGLFIAADTVKFSKGSVVQGAVTAEEDLFVPVDPKTENGKPVADEEAADGKEKKENEEEKEFKPVHVLKVVAKKTALDGKLSGGDYSIIRGAEAASSEGDSAGDNSENSAARTGALTVGESADIDLRRGVVSEATAVFSGKTKLEKFDMDIGEMAITHGDNTIVSLKECALRGDVLSSDGHLVLDHSSAHEGRVNFSEQADETLRSSHVASQDVQDQSQMAYQGQSGISADEYHHTGHVERLAQPEGSEEQNLFYVQAKSADLRGTANFDNAHYEIEHFADRTEFVTGSGRFSAYFACDSLALATKDNFHLQDTIQRDCNITVQASDIAFNANYNSKHDLTLVSTEGNVSLGSQINANNIYAKSARHIYTNNQVSAALVISFDAEGSYNNLGGVVNADTVAIKAAEIRNVTRGSNVGSLNSGLSVGSGGVINGRSKLFMEATSGDIVNHGGVIRAGEYAQLLAKGSVRNLCNERVSQGQYDAIRNFDGGLIAGGTGAQTDGVGLYIKAGGKVISDASDFVSNGTNYIEGEQGVEFTARQHTYVSRDTTERKWYGKKKHIVETSTIIRGSTVHSANGRNIIQSGSGGVSSVATCFSSPGGTDIFAKGNIQLYSLRANNMHYESTSKLWGITKNERQYVYDSSTPTLFVDNGMTRIVSECGGVDARGAYFIGAGDLQIKAKERIQLGVDILNHEVTEKTRGFDISAPGLGAWDALKNGGSAWQAATAEDATLARLDSLAGSNNAAELLANSSNLGIDLYNTTNSLMRGLAQGAMAEELLARYGLGGAAGFSPSVTVTLSESKSHSTYQTQAEGGINRGGNVTLEAGAGIDLENGVKVCAGGNIDVNAPEVIARAAELHSSSRQTTTSVSIGVALVGQPETIGVAASKTVSQATTYENAELSAGGNISFHNGDGAMRVVELDGASVNARTLDMNTDKLIIRDKQDVSQTKTQSASINSNGQVSAYKGKGYERTTNQHSGLNIHDGINTNGHTVKVAETEMVGGRIVTAGKNHFKTDRLTATTLVDEKNYKGIGISGNVNDLDRVSGQRSTNASGEQAVATAAVSFDRVDVVATQAAVIHGAQGTHVDVGELQGELHTTSADGRKVVKDKAVSIEVDVPITNRDYLERSVENIQAGKKKLVELLVPEVVPVVEKKVEVADAAAAIAVDNNQQEALPGSEEQDALPADRSLEQVPSEAAEHDGFDSPDVKQLFELAQTEINEHGELSPETETALKERLALVLTQTMKLGVESGWGKFVESLGPDYSSKLKDILQGSDKLEKLGLKGYLSSKSALINLTFNLVLSSMDKHVSPQDVVQDAVAHTASGVTVGLGVRLLTAEAAGPVGLAYFSLGVVDTLFYKQSVVDQLNQRGVSHFSDTQQHIARGDLLRAWATASMASAEVHSASRMEAVHALATLPDKVTGAYNGAMDRVRHRFFAPPATPSKQGFFKDNNVVAQPDIVAPVRNVV